jgi:uncharacterized protein (DUF885 family)
MKHKYFLGSAIALALTFGGCNNSTTTDVTGQAKDVIAETVDTDINAELDAWFEQKFMEGVKRSPSSLAALGIKERMDEWDDPSRAGELEELNYTRQDLAEMREKFDFDKLDADSQLSYRLMERRAEQAIEGDRFHEYGYPFNQMFGVQSGIPTFLLNRHKIDNVEDARNYIKRLEGVQDYLGTIVARSNAAFDKGINPPKFVYGHVIRDAGNVLKGLPFEEDSDDVNLLLNDFKTKVDKLDLDDETRKELYEGATTALLTSVGPAYRDMIAAMEAQQAKASTDDGVWKLPNADEYYAYRLKRITSTDMTADEIHDLGLKEVARIHAEMREIMKKVEFDGTLNEFFEFIRTDPQFVYPNTEEGRARYLKEATAWIDQMKEAIPTVFNVIPKAELEVKRVEAFREKSAGKAFYNRPAPDGSRPGVYYANLYNMEDMPIYQMEALAYHEGIPGHHMQLSISQELEGVPKFRKYGSMTAYTEGWGLYSEFLPKEMGFYKDPYSDFGRLAMEIWRAARLVVDTGLHDKKWTREEAIDYLVENTPNPKGDAIKAIERYIVMPGQATAYKIGMIKIIDLREEAKEKLGDKFNLAEYHDVVLASGPVPLNILEERVDAWVESKA